jgi:hypothetical protein
MTQEELLADLKDTTHKLIDSAKRYKGMKPQQLNARLNKDSWSILECFEHMNRYDAFYVNELRQKLEASPDIGSSERLFQTGWIGGRSANSMLPQANKKLNKMNTFKQMNPLGSELDASVIDTFIKDQRALLDIFRMAKEKNLNKVRVKLTLPLLKFKAGDAMRFIQNHNVRHMSQCKRVLDGLS